MNDSLEIAFNFEWNVEGEDTSLVIHNADERIHLADIRMERDSLTLQMPVFLSYFRMVNSEDGMRGYWYNPDRAPGYKMEAHFQRNVRERYPSDKKPAYSLYERWRVQLYAGTDREKSALGEFFQDANKVSGSILTATGDYRYLDGVVSGNRLIMSTFDGAHAYLFTARIEGPGKLNGEYRSGHHFMTKWNAVRDDEFSLPDAQQMTKLESEDGRFDFRFRDLDGKLFDSRRSQFFDNKVVAIQIMGSWCPNCMDETRYFTRLKEKFGNEGFDLLAITFERHGEWEKDKKAVMRMVKDLAMDYPVLYGGGTRHITDSLPQLRPFRSYPSTLFIDRKGQVRRIHAGFSGPGTSAFAAYAEETEAFLLELLQE